MAVKHDGIVSRTNLYMVDPRMILIQDGWNPRDQLFDSDQEKEEFKNSIRENGVLVPINVKKINDEIVLLNGQRRLTCTIELIEEGCEIVSVPCLFARNTISDTEAMILAFASNDGKRLTPLQEASAFNRLRNWGTTVSDIAKRVGKSEAFVYRRLLLVDACVDLRTEIRDKNINLTVAEEIIKSSAGDVHGQKKATKATVKSAVLSKKEIKVLRDEKGLEYERAKEKKDRDSELFFCGYLKAIENIMDRSTLIT